uniref:Uncharacterized protein n=1 Tax=Aegilops tauschii TaxID=37682 RepID=R7VYN7_AEGTA
MSAPNLETVRIRGCWGLRCLPAVSGSTTNRPKVDCEKDWWDNLEWEGLGAKHDPSLYEPSHSRYYKKAHLPRVTVLRCGLGNPKFSKTEDVNNQNQYIHGRQIAGLKQNPFVINLSLK